MSCPQALVGFAPLFQYILNVEFFSLVGGEKLMEIHIQIPQFTEIVCSMQEHYMFEV